MNDTAKSINYIQTELIPGMVERQQLTIDGIGADDTVRLDCVEAKPLQADGTFMLTVLYKVKVELSSAKDGTIKQERRLVVKITPQCTEEMYTGCQFDTLFENEMTAYTEIIPALGKAERYPKYFYSHRKPFEAVMVLSDYSTEGWRMAPMVVNLPLDYCLLAARELGRFHGECYALKEQQRDSFESMISKFKEARYGNDLGDMKWLAVMKTGPVRALKATRESIFSESIPEEFLQKLGDLAADPWEYSKKCVKPVEPLAVICHGDYLRNNIAFQFADEQAPGKPTQAMMFDFQTLRYASPMIDFATFIANSTGYDVRQKHFETIFKAYHDELVQTLCSIIKTNPDDLPQHYSYESFLREFTRYYIYGFLIATSFLMILHEPMENIFEMEQWSLEQTVEDAMKRGGAKLDREFAAMVYEIYKLHQRFGMDPM
ncbi:hypothetical protein RP20_CCG022387 [Aedes albopictus]|nr:hypothetical protein RP20_CCG022387 [Aedes albopictus]